jgi:hypothetical protein
LQVLKLELSATGSTQLLRFAIGALGLAIAIAHAGKNHAASTVVRTTIVQATTAKTVAQTSPVYTYRPSVATALELTKPALLTALLCKAYGYTGLESGPLYHINKLLVSLLANQLASQLANQSVNQLTNRPASWLTSLLSQFDHYW